MLGGDLCMLFRWYLTGTHFPDLRCKLGQRRNRVRLGTVGLLGRTGSRESQHRRFDFDFDPGRHI